MADPQHKLDLGKKRVEGLKVHLNVGQEMFVLTADQLRRSPAAPSGRHRTPYGVAWALQRTTSASNTAA
jgi:hypothetical protein